MSYHSETDYKNKTKITSMLKDLPAFVKQFDVSMSNQGKSTRTRLNYVYDYILFFDYLLTLEIFADKKTKNDFQIKDLEKINRNDIENYLQTYDVSRRNTKKPSDNNAESLKARKLASLRSLYSYYCSTGDILINPAAVTPMPKKHEKEGIVYLSSDEIQAIFNCIDTGAGLGSDRQIKAASKTKLRDKAIIGTLLGTGIRISECIGLDVKDVDFKNAALHLIRKGGDSDVAYFGEDVESLLQDYIENERELLKPETNALFVSTSHGRLSDRAVEYMVKKYVLAAGIQKHIKVHSLRATFATEIYSETNDVYMVKEALHHKSLTTSKHYVGGADERKRKAASVVKGLFH